MNRGNILLAILSPIPEKCSYCDRKAEYHLLAKGYWFNWVTKFLCHEHAKQWNNKSLEV
jgi:hypothetical protein